jgi:hypothetical protein
LAQRLLIRPGMMKLPAPKTPATRGRTGPRRDTGVETSTCVHCVTMRATARLARCHARAFTLCSCSPQAPRVAMDGPELYALVSHFLRDAAERCPADSAVRVRIISDVHPAVEVLAVTGTKRATRVHALAVARHADGSLMGGFAESYAERPTLDARGAR